MNFINIKPSSIKISNIEFSCYQIRQGFSFLFGWFCWPLNPSKNIILIQFTQDYLHHFVSLRVSISHLENLLIDCLDEFLDLFIENYTIVNLLNCLNNIPGSFAKILLGMYFSLSYCFLASPYLFTPLLPTCLWYFLRSCKLKPCCALASRIISVCSSSYY